MLPSLLIHDHILVNKLSYGIQNPVTSRQLFQWREPQRGDVVVFRFPQNPQVFFVKRLIGLPGDRVEVRDGALLLNGQPVPATPLLSDKDFLNGSYDGDDFDYYQESLGQSYKIRRSKGVSNNFGPITVLEKEYFVMGDNRDQSHDSRFWGAVPAQNLLGKAQIIWLTCDEMLESAQFLCDPLTIRWNRLLKIVE